MRYLLSINLISELLIISTCLLVIDSNFIKLDIFILLNIFWTISTFVSKNYYINRLPGVLINLINLSKLYFVFFLTIFFYLRLIHESTLSNNIIIQFSSILFISLLLFRVIVFYVLKKQIKNSENKINTIIVGVSLNSIHLKEFVDKHPQYGIHILGFFSEKPNNKANILGNYSEIMNYCLVNNVSEIICSIDKISKEFLAQLIDFSENNLMSIKVLPDSLGFFGRNFTTTFLEYIPLLSLNNNPFDDISNKVLKRSFDILFSLLIIILVLSWLFPIIGLLILIDSRGPILFAQDRTGHLNTTFKCLKFRTMIVNKAAHVSQAQKNDPRVTKIGAFLRKTSLDELPQFFNVLMGSMSVVGPRPHMIKHTEEYSQLVDKYMVRHLVKPGITGLSQIMGYRGETQHNLYLMKMRVRMDRFYIENWSFYLDLKVIYSTIIAMFKKNEQVY